MNLLLDTCTFLWLALEPSRLSPVACQLLDDPANQFFLSEVSVLEIVLKYAAKKLPLPEEPRQWIPSRRDFFGLKRIAINESSIYRAGELTPRHPDPFDRLLVGMSIDSGMTVLSPDSQLSTLGASRLW